MPEESTAKLVPAKLDTMIEILTKLAERDFERESMPSNFQNNVILDNGRVKETRKKESRKLLQAVRWTLANDPDFKMQIQQAATLADVSKGTIGNAREFIASGKYDEYLKSGE